MAKKAKLKTEIRKKSASMAINEIKDPVRRANCKLLLKLFKEATKLPAKVWGSSIIGFGEYQYSRANGDYAYFLATGFSFGKSGPAIYIIPGLAKYSSLLKNLGPHKISKSCLYIKDWNEVSIPVLKKLIANSLKDLSKTHQVNY